VVGSVILIITSISGIMFEVFNSQNKNKSSDIVNQSGSWILNELKKNVLNADSSGQKFICTSNSILITSIKDGDTTTISCDDDNGNIASESARTTVNFINNKELILTGCDTFVSCTSLDNGQLSKVTFNFTLANGMGNLSTGTSKNFSIDVTLRN
jgi:hypothetical protein